MAFRKLIDRKKVFETLKINPAMSFSEFKEKSNQKISDVSFYDFRKKYREEHNIKPFSLANKASKSSKKVKGKTKRSYVKSGKYSQNTARSYGASKRNYHRTTTYLLLWSQDTSKVKHEAVTMAQELVRCLQKSKKMNLELIETVNPDRLELREYSN